MTKYFVIKKFEGYAFIFRNAEGVHASLSECWKSTEKGWEPLAWQQDTFGAYDQGYTFAQSAVQTARWSELCS